MSLPLAQALARVRALSLFGFGSVFVLGLAQASGLAAVAHLMLLP
jgi:hypothetical protein